VCWWYADCILNEAPGTRKLQFSTTALVMGLVPLILVDIAWPERRIAYVETKLGFSREVLVRALGLNPVLRTMSVEEMAGKRGFSKHQSMLIAVGLWLALLSCLGILAVIELYSKRSALGCPAPVFIAVWFLVGLMPALLEVAASRWQERRRARKILQKDSAVTRQTSHEPGALRVEAVVMSPKPAPVVVGNSTDATRGLSYGVAPADHIPGGDKIWPVQFAWAVYYAAGTLVFTSIMLVTVVDLVKWILATCITSAVEKMVAYKLCGHWGESKRFAGTSTAHDND
jgi:hypothetical protein